MNIIGKKYGRLTVLKEVDSYIRPSGQKEKRFQCLCDCGNIVNIRKYPLTSGLTKSCGCIQKEVASKINTKHGKSYTHLNNAYRTIKSRCYNVNNRDYKDYGGRGIKMCDEWRNDFMAFYNWAIENGYDENKTIKEQSIDRIDVNGNYEPSNCRYVNIYVQARNKRRTKKYEYNGQMLDLKTISELKGVKYNTLWQRINKYGYTFEKALL